MGGPAAGMIGTRYQPIVRIADRTVAGFEVLARLEGAAGRLLLPDDFVPDIERAGLAAQFTDLVTARAFAELDAALLAAQGMFLAINLPLDVLLLVPEALDRMEARRRAAGIAAGLVTVELTESRPVSDLPGLAVAMERWRRAGYRLAVDDIGPGIANHQALLRLPFDAAKLDKQTVLAATQDGTGRAFLDDVVASAHASGLGVIAEGVEDAACWEAMRAAGVDQIQGFLVARPLCALDLPGWLEAWQAATTDCVRK